MNILDVLLTLRNWLDFQLGLPIRIASRSARAKVELIVLHLSSHEMCAGLFVQELLVGAAVTLKNYGGVFPSSERLQAFHRLTGNDPVAQNYEKKDRALRLLWDYTNAAVKASGASCKNRPSVDSRRFS